MMPWSYDENFMTIGQTVFKILRFSFFGTYFRRPSWILVRTEIRLLFVVSHDSTKLPWKLCNDRSNDLRYIEIWVFWRSFPADILDFRPNRKCIVCFWLAMMPRSYVENFMTIGETVFKILRFSFSGIYFRRPSWILVGTETGWCLFVSHDGMKLS